MARFILALFLTVGILSTSANGYAFQSARKYVSGIIEKASTIVRQPKDDFSVPYPTKVPKIACKEDGLSSDPSDCGNYIHCKNSVYHIVPCPNQQHFNNSTLKCEEPCDARCDRRLACECGWESCSTTEDDYRLQPSEDYLNSEATEEEIIPCPRDFSLATMNCSVYIQCSNKQLYVKTCPDDQHFSSQTKQCESPCVARCDPTLSCNFKWTTTTEGSRQPRQDRFTNSGTTEDGISVTTEAGNSDEHETIPCYIETRIPTMNCSVYLHCSNGTLYVKTCPEGLHFSQQTRRCETPCVARCDATVDCDLESAASKKMETSTHAFPYFVCVKEGMYPNPRSCNSYVQCANGESYVMPCPRGLHYSRFTMRCDRPCEARCDPRLAGVCGWTDIEEPEDDFEVCRRPPYRGPCDQGVMRYYFDIHEGICKRFVYGGCRSNGNNFKSERECSIKCLRDNSNDPMIDNKGSNFTCVRDGLFRNVEDCSTYIQCSEGQSYVMPCPKGLHFSEEAVKCVPPCDAHCDSTLADKCGFEEKDLNSYKSPKYPKSEAPQDYYCVKDGLYPNPFDCETYVHCSDGNSEVLECPEGMHYSQETQSCESACNAHCDPTLARECGWENREFRSVEQDFVCVKDGLHPNPENCSTFFQCVIEHTFLMPCPRGMHFNRLTRRCESPCEARCDSSLAESCDWKEGEYTVREADYDRMCGKYNELLNPEDCSTYIQCSNEQAYIVPCPEGLHYNLMSHKCVPPCDAYCDQSLENQCGWDKESRSLKQPVFDFTCLSNGLYENDADCGTFIQCTGGSAYLISCEIGLHFNSTTKTCQPPCQARCIPDIEECRDERSSKMFPKIHHRNAIKQPLYHEHDCLVDGLYRDTHDCTKYIQCSIGHSYVMPCPAGLHFSRETQRCEAPCDARCNATLAYRCGWELKDYADRKPEYDFACVHDRDGMHQHPDDCTAYIQCSDRLAYIVSCPNDLHFSSHTLKCEAPCDAQCDPSLEKTCGWDQFDVTSTDSGYDHDVSSTFHSSVVDFFTCLTDGVYPNPENCGTYYLCANGFTYVKLCPRGLHFSEDTYRCETKCKAHCDQTLACDCGWEECSSTETPATLRDNGLKVRKAVDCESEYDVGTCFGEEQRYFYDMDSGRCRTFTYSGCGGNANNFLTEADCRQKCQQRMSATLRDNGLKVRKEVDCESEYDVGTCFGEEQRYFYDVDSGRCRTFTYSGCGGNANNFLTEADCRQKCQQRMSATLRDNGLKVRKAVDCESEYDVGTCFGEEQRYFYDVDSGRCRTFTYSGCGGNANNFLTEADCREKCQQRMSATLAGNGLKVRKEVDCESEYDVGTCFGEEQRYFYDVDSGRCRTFTYSGCGGNANNFLTEADCREKCQQRMLGGYRCPAKHGKFGHYPDCTRYYDCKRGLPILKKCPRGTAFDHIKAKCTTEYKANCLYECREPDAAYPHDQDCRKYIDCVNGISKVERCPQGTAFDPVRRDCVDEEQVSSCPF